MEKSDLTQEDIEALRTLANSELRSAKYASKVLESFNIDTSETTPEPGKTLESPTEPTEPKGSVFAY